MKTPKHRFPSKNKRPQWYTRRSAKRDEESALRACIVEDKVIVGGYADPKKKLSELTSLAAQATDRLEEEVRALRGPFCSSSELDTAPEGNEG